MATYVGNTWQPGRDHDYLIAGNACNAFCIGEIGSPDDFFVVGVEPDPDSNYPMLTGNFLSSDGELLFRIVRNVLTLNPGHCSRINGNHVGYEIHDSAGNEILGVRTVFAPQARHADSKFMTTISGRFYDKNKRLVFSADSERIDVATNHAFGWDGHVFADVIGPPEYQEAAQLAILGRGSVYQVIRGETDNQEIDLDGKILIGARFNGCTFHVRSVNFKMVGCFFANCSFRFYDDYAALRELVLMIEQSGRRSA